jgi:hypothetical protein
VYGRAVKRLANSARIGLAAIRLFNGGVALVAPEAAARRLGAGPEPSPETIYALRLFGIRTVLLGADLLTRNEGARRRALDLALLVHVTDTLAAALAGARGGLPPRTARTLTVVSGTNSLLAALARRA